MTDTALNAIESLVVILLLALVHLFVRELGRLSTAARSAVLSAGAGASLAYVLMRILPKLAEKQDGLLASADTGIRGFLEHHAYLIAMLGLVTYYGLSRVIAYGAAGQDAGSAKRYRAALVSTIAGHGAYSMLIAYLIVNRLHMGLFSILLITLGMGTLFLVSDHGLSSKWPREYERWIKWVLTAALLAGWGVGIWMDVSENIVVLWYAFLAGVMLIITIGEKLAIKESSSFWPFLAGVAVFTVLLLILDQTPARL